MRVRMPSVRMQDVGPLNAVHALPTGSRIRHGMKTTCASCGKQITEEMFYAGFAQGQPNRMFHFDCLDEISQMIVEFPKCQACGLECKPGEGECLGNYIHFACKEKTA